MLRCVMWKKEDSKPAGVSGDPVNSATRSSLAARSLPATVGALPTSPRAAACISQGIRIKGAITGSEDLFVDGMIEGKLNLGNGSLTIGTTGHVQGDVQR